MSNYAQAKEWLTKTINGDCKTEAVIKSPIIHNFTSQLYY